MAALHSSTANAKVHVFVINTQDKVDKCHCISAQMAESKIPYSVSRLVGSTPKTMLSQCKSVPRLTELAQRIGASTHEGSESALFCSNYLAWKEALANHTDKDYIIVMEDDVFLKSKQDLWQKVDDLLASDCQHWDHINVDPYEGMHRRDRSSMMCRDEFKLMNPTSSGGAHMQIIRSKKLKRLIQHVEKHGAGIVDAFHEWMPHRMRKVSWKAGIVQQFNAKFHENVKHSLKPEYCAADVYKHQVTMRQAYGEKAPSLDLSFKTQSGVGLAFACEN